MNGHGAWRRPTRDGPGQNVGEAERAQTVVGLFANAHLYENLGESNVRPTRKRELEVGVNYYISQRYYAGISYFRHWQVADANDRFAVVKVKFGVNF